MEVFVRIDDISGLQILSTRPCRVTVSNTENCRRFTRNAKVVSVAALAKMRRSSHRADKCDRRYAPSWIYADELDGDAMRILFRKRGWRTYAIDEEDRCGDDTVDYFRKRVGIGDEEIVITKDGWRIFRNAKERETWEESDEAASLLES
jgi:hypothetical protein